MEYIGNFEFLGELIKLTIAGSLGGYVSYHLQKRAEAERIRRQYVSERLEEAFKLVLASMSHQGVEDVDVREKNRTFAQAINVMHLFADEETRKIADELGKKFASGADWIEYEPLLTRLRDSFRREIGLGPLNGPAQTLHVYRRQNDATDAEKDTSSGRSKTT